MPATPATDVVAALGDVLDAGAVIADPASLDAYRNDHAVTLVAGMPAAAVLPRTTDEVSEVLRVASRLGVPVVPRGAGSGLSGGANAVDGCVVLCTSRMDAILEIDSANRLARVQPGVVTATLRSACAGAGLMYPPDPSSHEFSTIGGNIATNAGGLCCVRYGVTRDHVLALECVLADGRVLRTGRRSVKGVAGYDLVSLLVGSEGTLAVVTEATLRLRPAADAAATLVGSFASLESAGRAVAATMAATVPSLLEVMDRTTVRAVEVWRHAGLDTDDAALIVAQSDLECDAAARQLDGVARAGEDAGARDLLRSTDAAESAALIAVRRMALPALERLGAVLLDDVAVPTAALPALLARVEEIAAARGVTVGTFGHAGDGNMHPTIAWPRGDAAGAAAALLAFDDIVGATLALGGTVTGEHGVGSLKRTHLAREVGEVSLALHRAVKDAFDPQGILNPGKAF